MTKSGLESVQSIIEIIFHFYFLILIDKTWGQKNNRRYIDTHRSGKYISQKAYKYLLGNCIQKIINDFLCPFLS